jgi:hypothetical protein
VLNGGVRAREEQPFAAVVAPPNYVRRAAILTPDVENLGIAVRLAHAVAFDHQPIANSCTHNDTPSSALHRRVLLTANHEPTARQQGRTSQARSGMLLRPTP